MEIADDHHQLKCIGFCGNVFHLSCLTGKNKLYKKNLITAIIGIQNLIWFCDECLPNILMAFTPATTQQEQQKTNAIDDFVIAPDTIDDSAPISDMETDELPHNDGVNTNSRPKRSRSRSPSTQATEDDSKRAKKTEEAQNDLQLSDLVLQSATSSDNNIPISSPTDMLRCIYVTNFKPTTNEVHIIDYLNKKDDISGFIEKIDCKKLVPAWKRIDELTFVSFKITVPAECFDMIVDHGFWPLGVEVKEFVVQDKPKRSSKNNKGTKELRFNPFSIRKPRSRSPNLSHNTQNTANSHQGPSSSTKSVKHSMPAHKNSHSNGTGTNRKHKNATPQQQKNVRAPFKSQRKRQHYSINASQKNQLQNHTQTHSFLSEIQILQNVLPLLSALSPLIAPQVNNRQQAKRFNGHYVGHQQGI